MRIGGSLRKHIHLLHIKRCLPEDCASFTSNAFIPEDGPVDTSENL